MFICSRFHSSLTSSSSFADFMPLSFSSCSTHLPLLRQFFTFFPLPLPPPPLSFPSLAFLSFFQLSSSCSFTRFLFSRFLFFSSIPPPPRPPPHPLPLGNFCRPWETADASASQGVITEHFRVMEVVNEREVKGGEGRGRRKEEEGEGEIKCREGG